MSYCFFGVGLIIGPQLAKLFLRIARASLAYILMCLSFVIPSIFLVCFVYFPPNELKKVALSDLFRSRQNLFMSSIFFAFGMGTIMLSTFQTNYIEWFGRSEELTFDVYTFLNFFTPVPRLLAGYSQDWFGAIRVSFYFTISYSLNFLLFFFFGKAHEGVYLGCFFYLIFCMHSFPPLLLGINQHVWGEEGRKMFSVMFPIYSFGTFISSIVSNEFGIQTSCAVFGSFGALIPVAVLFLRQKQQEHQSTSI